MSETKEFKITYNDIIKAINVSNEIGKIIDPTKDTIFINKLHLNSPKWTNILERYNKREKEIDIDNCIERDGILVRNADKSLAFSKEGEKARNLAIEKLKSETVLLKPFYCKLTPSIKKTLGASIIIIFSGILFKREDVDNYLIELENEEEVEIKKEEVKN